MKEGSSELYHLDWNDDTDHPTIVIPVGPGWEGGEFCAPQLGIKIPIRPGQVFLVMARILAHCSSPVTAGRRLIFTCFADHTLLRKADRFTVIGETAHSQVIGS